MSPGLSEFTGYPLEIIDPQRIAELHPLAVLDGLLGGIYEPDDGHVDPSLATNAMAKVAQRHGAVIQRYNPVQAIRRENGRWVVETKNGTLQRPAHRQRRRHLGLRGGPHDGRQRAFGAGAAPVSRHRHGARHRRTRRRQARPNCPSSATRRKAGTAGRSATASSSAPTKSRRRSGRSMACRRSSAPN